MTVHGKLRGHPMHKDKHSGQWRFDDTGEPTAEAWLSRPCGHCGEFSTPEGHDPCLGTLPGVINACCGHGVTDEAYIQFVDGSRISGIDAIELVGILKSTLPGDGR